MIQHLAHTLRTQSRTESMITDLQKTVVFNTFSEVSKRTIQSLGNIDYSNWVKSLPRPNAQLMPTIGQKDSCIVLAVNA